VHDNTKPLCSFEVGDLVFVKPITQMGTRESHQDHGTALLSSWAIVCMERLYTMQSTLYKVSPTYVNLIKTNQNWRVRPKSLLIKLTHSPYLTYLLKHRSILVNVQLGDAHELVCSMHCPWLCTIITAKMIEVCLDSYICLQYMWHLLFSLHTVPDSQPAEVRLSLSIADFLIMTCSGIHNGWCVFQRGNDLSSAPK